MQSTEKEALVELERFRYEADDTNFKIAELTLLDNLDGEMHPNPYGSVVVKGNMDLLPNVKYIIRADEINDPKWGYQYNLIYSKRENPIEAMAGEQFKEFLATISNEKIADNIFDTIDNPREVFEKQDVVELSKVKGIGAKTAQKYFDSYQSQKDYSPAFVEFGKFGFTQPTTKKIVDYFRGVDNAISELQKDPYKIMEVPGMGFQIIDKKALVNGMHVNDKRRVKAFIKNYFDNQASDGNSWVLQTQLYGYLGQEIHNIDMKFVMNYVNESDNYKVFKRDGETCVADRKRFDIEMNIANELVRILNHKSNYELKHVEETIQKVQDEQGFDYSEEQYKAIKTMLNRNVFVLQGYAGTGKSTALKAVARIFQDNNLTMEQCALSGKAADNLSQITGKDGKTIHRLLGWKGEGRFDYDKKNPLGADVIILDEISMVDVDIFYSLLKAIPNGAKLIMLGDGAQLDSIGVGVMSGMLKSGIIPTQTLSEIHRQAQDSAIITHSLAYRQGKYPAELKSEDGKRRVYGVKKDLGYMFVPNGEEDQIVKETSVIFDAALHRFSVNDIQIITPTISSGKVNCDKLNQYCQIIANPAGHGRPEIKLKRRKNGKDESFVLREGDKVINMRNNYKTVGEHGEVKPIYNGNTGIIKKIDVDYKMKSHDDVILTIDFDGIGRVGLSKDDLKSIQLGYCITVHKSQGSTIPFVIVALPFQYKLDSRELLYTAITRASKSAYIMTSTKTLNATIRKTSSVTHHNNLDILIRVADQKFKEMEKK